MPKVKIISIILLGTIAAYIIVWFYQAKRLEHHLGAMMSRSMEDLFGERLNFFYSTAEVKGFPFQFIITLKKPHIVVTGVQKATEISSHHEMVIKVTPGINAFTITLPKQLNIALINNYEHRKLNVHYIKHPVVHIRSDQSNGFFTLLSDIRKSMNALYHNVREVTYHDEGYRITNVTNNALLARGEKTILKLGLNNKQQNKKSLAMQWQGKQWYIDALTIKAEQKRKKNNDETFDFFIKTSANVPEMLDKKSPFEADLFIEHIKLITKNFAIEIYGNLQTVKDDLFLSGEVEMRINKYSTLIDYLLELSAQNHYQVKASSQQIAFIKTFLAQLASLKGSNPDNIFLTFTRQKKDRLYIGDTLLTEAMAKLKQGLTQYATRTKKTAKRRVGKSNPPDLINPIAY